MEFEFWEKHLRLLACPECHSDLSTSGTSFACTGCGARWPVTSGIPEFLRSPVGQSQFYDTEYWGKSSTQEQTPYDHFYLKVVRSWLERLELTPGDLYLDVSCGQGHAMFEATRRGVLALGVDISRVALRTAQLKFALPGGILADVSKLPFRERIFDRVSCLGALEHYHNPEAALSEIRRVSTESARFLFVVPNANYPLLRLHGVLDRQVIVTILDRQQWVAFLGANGFRVLEQGPDNHTLHRPLFPFRLRGVVRRCLAPIVDWAGLERAWQFYFLCEKAAGGGRK